MKFNFYKYKQWLKDKEKEYNVTIDYDKALENYYYYHGLDERSLWLKGLVVLKEWCD